MLDRNVGQTGTMLGTIYNRGWEKAGKNVISIRGSEIMLPSNSFETKDGNAQLGDARMILWIDRFVLKSSRGVFGLLRQSQCVLSMAQCQCLEQPPEPQHSPVALDMFIKASISFSFCKSNPIQGHSSRGIFN